MMFAEITSTTANGKRFLLLSSVCIIVPRGKRKMNLKQSIKAAVQINSNSVYIFITCKLMLGTGIVTFITPAAGQLVCEDLQ